MNLKIHTKSLFIILILVYFEAIGSATGLTSVGTHNIIGLSYKKDCIVSIGGSFYSKYTAQAGFAFSDFIAFQVGYQYSTDNEIKNERRGRDYTEFYKDYFAHASVGVFYSIPIKNSKWGIDWKNRSKVYSSSRILLDLFLAYGKGLNKRLLGPTDSRSGNLINDENSKATINLNRWYAQGGFHYYDHIVGGSISGLLGILNFRKIAIRGVPESEMIDLIHLFREDATYLTYGFQFKVWLCFDAFTLLYHNHQNFISKQEFLNRNLYNHNNEVSIQVNINRLFKKKVDEL